MNQTRFYVVENRNRAVQVNLLIGGLPPLLSKEEYEQLMERHLSSKSEWLHLNGSLLLCPVLSITGTLSIRLTLTCSCSGDLSLCEQR